MKTLSQHISEKLIINKNYKHNDDLSDFNGFLGDIYQKYINKNSFNTYLGSMTLSYLAYNISTNQIKRNDLMPFEVFDDIDVHKDIVYISDHKINETEYARLDYDMIVKYFDKWLNGIRNEQYCHASYTTYTKKNIYLIEFDDYLTVVRYNESNDKMPVEIFIVIKKK